jgi:glycosyltransferase involved in cell wall biosynthesis
LSASPAAEVLFAIPGELESPTGGYTYDRRVLALLPRFSVAARHVQLPASFPAPTAADLAATERLLSDAGEGAVLLVDGLAYGALPEDLVRRLRNPVVALVHHPLCLETGLSPQRQNELRALEKAALALARRIVATSRATARLLARDFAVPESKIVVAEPGTDPAQRAPCNGAPVRFLAVGAIVPRKGYDVLVRALAPVAGYEWRLAIVGATDRSPETLAALKAALRAARLDERVALTGPMDQERLGRAYAQADALLMPSLFEGYGMALAEAMARGLPIVCTTGGAAAETAPDEAAIKVPPGDVEALSAAIRRLLDEPELRRRMAEASWAAGQKLPRWEDTAHTIAAVVKELAP